MKVDLETLKVMKEMFTSHRAGEIVDIKDGRQDSFALLRGGLKDNLVFITLMVSACWFVWTSIEAGKAKDVLQDTQITSITLSVQENAKSIDQLTQNLQTTNTNSLNSYNELIRKIDSLQSAIDTLKANQ